MSKLAVRLKGLPKHEFARLPELPPLDIDAELREVRDVLHLLKGSQTQRKMVRWARTINALNVRVIGLEDLAGALLDRADAAEAARVRVMEQSSELLEVLNAKVALLEQQNARQQASIDALTQQVAKLLATGAAAAASGLRGG